jgi:hypothetical protein
VATFDQLSPDQRAILELVLKRGQSYEELSELLGMPESRVRELARSALVELAPVSAEAVDGDWRGQLADYVLGQQTGAESTATRGHLRRSEAARTWARSLMDSLDDLYDGAGPPAIPEGERATARPERKPRRLRAAAPPEDGGRRRDVADEEGHDDEPRRALSPEARSAVRRRRIMGAAAAAALLIALAVLVWPIGLLTGDDGNEAQPAANRNQPRLVGQTVLRPVEGNRQGGGVAVVAERNGQRQLIVQAQLPPSQRRQAYEVWLYNSDGDAQSIGAQVTDRQGRYQGAGPLPRDFDRFSSIDISREPIDRNARHSGNSVLRGPLAPLKGEGNAGGQPGQPAPQQGQPAPQQQP